MNFRQEDTEIFVSWLNIIKVYNSQNEKILAPSRTEADAKGGIKKVLKFSKKVMVWLVVCSKGVSFLWWFSNREPLIMNCTYQKCSLSLSNSERTCSATTGRFSEMEEGHIFVKELKIGVWLIYHLSLTKNIAFQIILILIRWVVVFGMYLAGAINWDLTISKAILINQLTLSLKKIRSEVVFESCIYLGPIDCIEWNKLMATVYIHKVGLLL